MLLMWLLGLPLVVTSSIFYTSSWIYLWIYILMKQHCHLEVKMIKIILRRKKSVQ